jgi:O-methyltransferase
MNYIDMMLAPWKDDDEFKQSFKRVAGNISVPEAKCWTLWTVVKRLLKMNLDGEYWECGVFRGGSAALISDALRNDIRQPTLRLLDTFTGIPYRDAIDKHNVGDFDNTSIGLVKKNVNYIKTVFNEGIIPDSFAGLEASKIVFCHADLDIYRSTKECCEFVWPRLIVGGVMVFDDYAVPSCPGARVATDEFFVDKRVLLFQGANGEAVAIKPPQDGDVIVRPPEGWTIELKSPNVKEWSLGRLKVSWK